MTEYKETQMIDELKRHLKSAKLQHWNIDKLLFIDGFLKALNIAIGKNYGFSGTNVYLTDNNGRHIIFEEE